MDHPKKPATDCLVHGGLPGYSDSLEPSRVYRIESLAVFLMFGVWKFQTKHHYNRYTNPARGVSSDPNGEWWCGEVKKKVREFWGPKMAPETFRFWNYRNLLGGPW